MFLVALRSLFLGILLVLYFTPNLCGYNMSSLLLVSAAFSLLLVSAALLLPNSNARKAV
jgi:hypothetical protein